MNKTSTLISVVNHCLQWLYKVPSLDDGGFDPWPLGRNVVFEINPNARIDVGQTKLSSMHGFCHKPLPIIAVQGPQPRR